MIKGKKVSLGPLRDTDSHTLFGWINERELVVNSSNYRPIHRQSHDDWFSRIQRNESVRIFAIRENSENDLIGSCQLHSIDLLNSGAELQIRIGRDSDRGKGYGSEAVDLLLRHAFLDLGLHRVYLEVYESNQAAIRSYEKVGFRTEGVMQDANFVDGKYRNIVLMAILQNEWGC